MGYLAKLSHTTSLGVGRETSQHRTETVHIEQTSSNRDTHEPDVSYYIQEYVTHVSAQIPAISPMLNIPQRIRRCPCQ